ncbi:MAG TPA: hypothetical protein VLK82_25970 [Candidatus Tectomicrobia bacterium]|nr:hypothetical protein [Candidatus Tectomicrobia bacterium]
MLANVISRIYLGLTAMALLFYLACFASARQVGVDGATLPKWTGHPTASQLNQVQSCTAWIEANG